MRIILTIVAVELLRLPYLKLVGAALLLWIAVQLLLPEDDGDDGAPTTGSLFAAIRTILIADLVMSLDNVIGVAAAAKGSLTLLILGLAISIPLVIFGSTLLREAHGALPDHHHGWGRRSSAGWRATWRSTDPAVKDWVDANAAWLHTAAPAAGAILVVAVGKWLAVARRSPGGERARGRPRQGRPARRRRGP